MGDLGARGADVREVRARAGDVQVVRAFIPLASMFGYATSIRSLSQGRGTFTMEFNNYAEIDLQRMDAIAHGYGL